LCLLHRGQSHTHTLFLKILQQLSPPLLTKTLRETNARIALRPPRSHRGPMCAYSPSVSSPSSSSSSGPSTQTLMGAHTCVCVVGRLLAQRNRTPSVACLWKSSASSQIAVATGAPSRRSVCRSKHTRRRAPRAGSSRRPHATRAAATASGVRRLRSASRSHPISTSAVVGTALSSTRCAPPLLVITPPPLSSPLFPPFFVRSQNRKNKKHTHRAV